MRDYCGKNGCYELEKVEDDEEVLGIYLNSPIVYDDLDGEFIRTTATNRDCPEVEFNIQDASRYSDKEEHIVTSMEVSGLGMDGVNEFVSALLKHDINDKDDLIFAVKHLLNKDDTVWGVIKPDEIDD